MRRYFPIKTTLRKGTSAECLKIYNDALMSYNVTENNTPEDDINLGFALLAASSGKECSSQAFRLFQKVSQSLEDEKYCLSDDPRRVYNHILKYGITLSREFFEGREPQDTDCFYYISFDHPKEEKEIKWCTLVANKD